MSETVIWDEKNNIFNFIFDMAFRDATLRSALVNPYKKDNNNSNKEDEKDVELKFDNLKKT